MVRRIGEIMKKIITCTIIFSAILGCSHTQNNIELVQTDRIKVNQTEYVKPDFILDKDVKFTKGRMPASVVREDFKHLSNRQLYFLSSYALYKTYQKSLKIKDEIKSCPSFHDLMLKEDIKKKQTVNVDLSTEFTKVKDDISLAAQYPVLALPYSDQADLYSVMVQRNWENPQEHLEHALKEHYKNTEKELAQLCETGVSPGYYIYENLVTYFKQQKNFHRTKDGLKALLKVPVIANMLIVDSMSLDYKINPIEKYNTWLLSRSNTAWINEYFSTIKEKRTQRLSKNL
jgi:hypothetical protein